MVAAASMPWLAARAAARSASSKIARASSGAEADFGGAVAVEQEQVSGGEMEGHVGQVQGVHDAQQGT